MTHSHSLQNDGQIGRRQRIPGFVDPVADELCFLRQR
jgi:hypothetical protein